MTQPVPPGPTESQDKIKFVVVEEGGTGFLVCHDKEDE